MPEGQPEKNERIATKNLQIERYLAFGFGVIFICTMLAIAIVIPDPSSFQYKVFVVVLSLAASGFATTVPGFLVVDISKYIKAGGAIAVFLICYYSSPAYMKIISGDAADWTRQSVSYVASYPKQFRVNVSSQGNINVLEDSMKIFAKDVTVSYPAAVEGIQDEFLDKIVVTLNCYDNGAQGTKFTYRARSNPFELDRTIHVGETIRYNNLDFEIKKVDGVKLAQCNIQFTIYVGTEQGGSGLVYGAPAPFIFQ